jgi:hypothetical protein
MRKLSKGGVSESSILEVKLTHVLGHYALLVPYPGVFILTRSFFLLLSHKEPALPPFQILCL